MQSKFNFKGVFWNSPLTVLTIGKIVLQSFHVKRTPTQCSCLIQWRVSKSPSFVLGETHKSFQRPPQSSDPSRHAMHCSCSFCWLSVASTLSVVEISQWGVTGEPHAFKARMASRWCTGLACIIKCTCGGLPQSWQHVGVLVLMLAHATKGCLPKDMFVMTVDKDLNLPLQVTHSSSPPCQCQRASQIPWTVQALWTWLIGRLSDQKLISPPSPLCNALICLQFGYAQSVLMRDSQGHQNTQLAMTRAVVVVKVTVKSMTGTPILHVEASLNSAERGLRPGSWAKPLSNITFILASF